MSRIFAKSAAVAATAAGAYISLTWYKLSLVDTRTIASRTAGPGLFRISRSTTSIINPQGNQTLESSRSITINVPRSVSDEVLLAKFVKGFFGGYVFAPEATILWVLRANFVRFSELAKIDVPCRIWSGSELSGETLPPLHTVLFGTFQIVDRKIHDQYRENYESSATPSYIDIAFGSDRSRFSGVHRFSISRDGTKDDDTIRIEFSDVVCNPSENRAPVPELMVAFHNKYAMLLFREAISNVIE
ncbi:hypothetical protein CC78DRAFT_618620 [Lojkania enalia]|uniref:Uncharacterized protein n=1 Tax=Lojkania enalia TaxID=147567 RepID=A0A9P4N1I5_9PLEO|nr:hypothetical protein CC78DRAFT_618620 [Didymosphaeria enalia]